MRKIKEVLRLKWSCGTSNRVIARSCSIGRSTVAEYLNKAEAAGLSWPLSEELDDARLDALLYPPTERDTSIRSALPDWAEVHQELKRRGVTLMLLWQEHKAQYPDCVQYSRFCSLYKAFNNKLSLSMRQVHVAGEKLFVDYAGQTIPITDSATGEITQAQVFIAVMGASNYTFAEITASQKLADWLGSHVRAFRFFGGVPQIVVPDNLKSGVSKPCRYEPEINPAYADLARHYGVTVIPARVRKPKDKAKAEGGVLLVERWILAALRNRVFFSVSEANQAVAKLLERLNERAFKKLPGSRKSQFELLDKPMLSSLPATHYEYAEWKHARAGIDYHVEVEGHYYSVPFQLYKKQLDVRISRSAIECFSKGKLVAAHPRAFRSGHTTINEHMPKSHREYAEWNPERIINWSRSIGEHTAEAACQIMARRQHPQQGFRACMGLMSLAKKHGKARLEAACNRALISNCVSYKSIKSILTTGLDQQPLTEPQSLSNTPEHDNIRGAHYYH